MVKPSWLDAKLTPCGVRTSTFLERKRILTLLDIRWVHKVLKQRTLAGSNSVYLPVYLGFTCRILLANFWIWFATRALPHPCRSEYLKSL